MDHDAIWNLINRYDTDFEERCRRRLREELGINEEGVEVILQMRRTLLAMQEEIRRMELELTSRQAARRTRLAQYQIEYLDASWYDLEVKEE